MHRNIVSEEEAISFMQASIVWRSTESKASWIITSSARQTSIQHEFHLHWYNYQPKWTYLKLGCPVCFGCYVPLLIHSFVHSSIHRFIYIFLCLSAFPLACFRFIYQNRSWKKFPAKQFHFSIQRIKNHFS